MNMMPFEKRSFGEYLKQSMNGGNSADYGNIFDFYKTINDEAKRDNTLSNLYNS